MLFLLLYGVLCIIFYIFPFLLFLVFQYLNYWRIGLRWDVFPDKLWQNGIVPYVISDLYGTYVSIYNYIFNIIFNI